MPAFAIRGMSPYGALLIGQPQKTQKREARIVVSNHEARCVFGGEDSWQWSEAFAVCDMRHHIIHTNL